MPPAIIPAVIGGAALLGSAAINRSAQKTATKAADRSADQNDATNRYIFDQTRADLRPLAQAGAPAVNALMQRAGLAPAAPSGQGVAPQQAQPQAAGPDYAAYVAANPDLVAAQQSSGTSPEQFGQQHYQQHGQAEGRQLPQAQAPAPAATVDAKPAGGNAGVSPSQPGAPNLMEAARPDAQPAPTFQRPQDQPIPTYDRPTDRAAPTYGDAPKVSSYVDPSRFTTSPDYIFRRDQGLDAANSGFAARGMLKSGAAAKGISDYASNLASAEYGSWFQRQMQQYQADNSQFNTDRGFTENNYRYGQDRGDNIFAADRSYGTNLALNQQGRADQNFENDRTSGTAAYQYGQNRADNIFSEDRGYQTGRYDQQTSNLFGIAGIGANAAAGTASAGNVFAQNSTANNNQRAGNTANAAIAGAQNTSNLIGQGLQAYGMYKGGAF